MATIHPGATLTPHFRDFLPGWVQGQPWYANRGAPSLRTIGYYRLEDADGRIGIETHLISDGDAVYQVPLTYRDAPLAAGELIATAEHSVLGTRWIYDGCTDPVWLREMLHLVSTEGVSGPSSRRGVGPADARGRRCLGWERAASRTIELNRLLTARPAEDDPDVIGVVLGRWHPQGADLPGVEGCLAVVRSARSNP
ncbi:MAG: hypothetical protein WCB04_06100 [Mycobacteriales bacterium]